MLARLVEWLGAPEQAALRRAIVVWLERVLLPARIPGADIPHITEPAWVDQRLEQASTAELEAWADRVLDCQTLEAVFDGPA